MRCEDCGDEFTGTRCACGWKAPSLAPYGQGEWIVGYCEIPGCGVRIRYCIGNLGNPQCKWHQAGMAYNSPENKKKQPDTCHAA